MSYLKEISKSQIETLITRGIIRNTHRGYVNGRTGSQIGYYRTKGAARKRYIQDWCADKAAALSGKETECSKN